VQFLFVGLILLFNLKEQLRSVILIPTFMFCLHLVMAVIFHHTFSFFSVIFSLYISCMFYPLEPAVVSISSSAIVSNFSFVYVWLLCVSLCFSLHCMQVWLLSVDTLRNPVCSFFLIYVSRNGNVHAKYCFKHWAMDDSVTASCIKTASAGLSDIYMCVCVCGCVCVWVCVCVCVRMRVCVFFLFLQIDRVWMDFLFVFEWNCKHYFKWSTEGLKKQ